MATCLNELADRVDPHHYASPATGAGSIRDVLRESLAAVDGHAIELEGLLLDTGQSGRWHWNARQASQLPGIGDAQSLPNSYRPAHGFVRRPRLEYARLAMASRAGVL